MKSSQQAGYLSCWPEPGSTACLILKRIPTGNPTRTPDTGGDPTETRTVLPGEPANISQSPWRVLEVKEDKLADHTSSGRNKHQMKSFSKAGRTVRMVRRCQDSRWYGEDGQDRHKGKLEELTYETKTTGMLVEYTSWRSWDRCIHFLNSGNSRKESPSTNDRIDPVPKRQTSPNNLLEPLKQDCPGT